MHAAERGALGRDDSTLAEVRELLSLKRTPPETDHWLVEGGGVAIAWGMVTDDYGGEQVDLDVYADPAHPDTVREAVLDVLLNRVRELARERENGEVTVGAGVIVGDEPNAAALRGRGFVAERRFNRLRIELDGEYPVPAAPDGVALDGFDPESDGDWADWHAILLESFSEHWGYEQTSLAAWREALDAEEDPEFARWRFALVDGVRAGICQASGRFASEGGGWIRNLGVVPSARGRGAGRYLLEQALASYAADGRSWAGLGVDTGNVSGALRLYESAGMRPWMQINAFRRRVYAGG
ncbi:MAG TPA: GNAT family N-acetyltransferase [Jiangellaceae bacterium]|nr:GNAT family N-acetyltransferase [Jiangellaceae bacterium]